MSVPKFSIVIPVRDRADLIGQTLESIRCQSFDGYEVMVVDDGSTDGTPESVHLCSKKDPRFRLISQNPTGRSAARNTGIENSIGEWLVFLDSDDLLQPRALETFSSLIDSCPSGGMLTGRLEFIDSAGDPIAYKPLERLFPFTRRRGSLYAESIRTFSMVPGTYCIKRELATDLLFDPACECCEDQDFFLRATLLTEVEESDLTVLLKRDHPGNTSALELNSAWLRVGEKHLRDFVSQAPDPDIAGAEWLHKMADSLFDLGFTFKAFRNYFLAIFRSPVKISDQRLIIRLLTSPFPPSIRNKVKMAATSFGKKMGS